MNIQKCCDVCQPAADSLLLRCQVVYGSHFLTVPQVTCPFHLQLPHTSFCFLLTLSSHLALPSPLRPLLLQLGLLHHHLSGFCGRVSGAFVSLIMKFLLDIHLIGAFLEQVRSI